MKELRSRRYPHRQPKLVSDEQYELLKEKGIARRFLVKDIEPVRNIIPTPKIVPPVIDTKKTKKQNND